MDNILSQKQEENTLLKEEKCFHRTKGNKFKTICICLRNKYVEKSWTQMFENNSKKDFVHFFVEYHYSKHTRMSHVCINERKHYWEK